jgi:tRNA-uridine aminocarboxypropyltransferase
VSPVDNRTAIWILQHKRERHHPIGTARIAELGLLRSRVDVCYEPPGMPSRLDGVALLYPGLDSRPLASLEPQERPERLVVLDGTWNHARVMYRDFHWLHTLPRYSIEPEQGSRYRIRKEPRHDCLSTIEAIIEALMILEPETAGLEGLLTAFERMIDRQLASHRPGSRASAS